MANVDVIQALYRCFREKDYEGFRRICTDDLERIQNQGFPNWRLPQVANLRYGYLWFSGSMSGRQVVFGWGYGGQFALVAPALRLVVATAATSPSRENLVEQTQSVMALVAQVVGAAA